MTPRAIELCIAAACAVVAIGTYVGARQDWLPADGVTGTLAIVAAFGALAFAIGRNRAGGDG